MLTTLDVKELRVSMGKAWESAYYASAKEPTYKPDVVLADKAAFDLFISWLYDNRSSIKEYLVEHNIGKFSTEAELDHHGYYNDDQPKGPFAK